MPEDYLSNVDFSDTSYTLRQRAVRNAYKLYDSSGKEILRTKQELLKMKEEFPFKNPDGEEVFRIKAENIMDIAGDYVISDSVTGEEIAILEKEFSVLIHSWKVKDPEGRIMAEIQSRGKFIGLFRHLTDLAMLLPHKYSIEDGEGHQIGTIKGRLSITDKYDIEFNEDTENKEVLMAASVTVDALEAN